MNGTKKDENKDETPELHNSEQDDEGQAQDVADDAMALGSDSDKAEQSEHARAQGFDADGQEDTPDLVDRMEQMISSGLIDNSAFRGEPEHDDEEDMHGNRDDEDEDEEDDL